MAYLEVKDANGTTRRLLGRYDGSDFIPENESTLLGGITTSTVTIAETESLSGTIDLGAGARQLTNVRTPAVWTAASISFAVSDDDVTFVPLYYDGEEFVILELAGAAASCGVSLPRDAFAGWAYVRVRSGTEAAPVAQAAARVLSVSSRA